MFLHFSEEVPIPDLPLLLLQGVHWPNHKLPSSTCLRAHVRWWETKHGLSSGSELPASLARQRVYFGQRICKYEPVSQSRKNRKNITFMEFMEVHIQIGHTPKSEHLGIVVEVIIKYQARFCFIINTVYILYCPSAIYPIGPMLLCSKSLNF